MTEVPLTLGFSQSANVPGAIGSLSNDTIALLYHDLGNLSQFVNLQVQVPNTAGNTLPAVVFVRGLNGSAKSPWTETMLASNSTAVVSNIDSDSTDAQPRLAALGAALGLTSPGAFNGSNIASVTTTSTNTTCARPSRFGAYDLAVLASKYGLSATSAGNQTITLTKDFGSGGILTSAATNNTLRAVYGGNLTVQLSGLDDGSWPSLVGDTHVLLAPGSVITNLDASQTQGAVIIGNNHTNYITGSGSEDGDTISVGAGLTYVGAGSNESSLVINYPDTTVVWNGITQNPEVAIYVAYDRSNTNTNNFINVTVAANGAGSELTINNVSKVQFPQLPLSIFKDWQSLVEGASDAGNDYSIPVQCSSSLVPVYIPTPLPPPAPPKPPTPTLASPPPPTPTATPSGSGSGSGTGGFGNNVPGYSGWIDPWGR